MYLVMELATGGELLDILNASGRFSEPFARYYFRQLIEGMEYLNKKGVVHRDLKPENLLFSGKDYAMKICDFGFADVTV